MLHTNPLPRTGTARKCCTAAHRACPFCESQLQQQQTIAKSAAYASTVRPLDFQHITIPERHDLLA